MTTFLQKANNAKTVLNTPVLAADLTISVNNGSVFPASGSFMITIWDRVTYPDPSDDPTMEVIKCTSRTGGTLTVVRAQEGTSASDHATAQVVEMLFTKAQILELETAINALETGKVDANSSITGATKTKITYDVKGLVTSGADATTADIADSSNKRYITDAQQTVLGNTSGINTGDQSLTGYVPYTGASGDIDLGLNGLSLNYLTITGITASRLIASDSSKNLVSLDTATYPSLTELSYIKGLTSAIQSQINNKQTLDSTLTALAGYNTNGILVQTASDTFVGRTITGTANKISVSDGDGVSANPTINIHSGYVGQTSITTLGTIATGIWNGTAITNAYLANSTISGISLGNNLASLTATNTTLTLSGSYDGSTARTIGINLTNANIWSGLQTFSTSSISITGGTIDYLLSTDGSGNLSWVVAPNPAGSDAELQYRLNGTTFGAAIGSAVDLTGAVALGLTTPLAQFHSRATISNPSFSSPYITSIGAATGYAFGSGDKHYNLIGENSSLSLFSDAQSSTFTEPSSAAYDPINPTSATFNFFNSGYIESSYDFTYQIWALYGGQTQISAGSIITANTGGDGNDGFTPYAVDVAWTAPAGPTPDAYLVYVTGSNPNTGSYQVVPSSSFTDTNTGWTTSSSYGPLLYQVGLYWTLAPNYIDNYIVKNLDAGSYNIVGNVASIIDDTTWTVGSPTITPVGKYYGAIFEGNVGIGNTTPAYSLDVSGPINTTTDYLINGTPAIAVKIDSLGNIYSSNTNAPTGGGNNNVIQGLLAGGSLNGGSFNVFLSRYSGTNTTTGLQNFGAGDQSLFSNNIGNGNLAIGSTALALLTGNSNHNTAIGFGAAASQTGGDGNVMIGYNANVFGLTSDYQLSIQNAIFGVGNSGQGATVSSGGIGFYSQFPNSSVEINGSFAVKYVSKSANYTMSATDYLVNCTANSFTITLPNGSSGIPGRMYKIKNSGTGVITLNTTSSQQIDGLTSYTLAQYQEITVMSNGSQWIIVDSHNFNLTRTNTWTLAQTFSAAPTFSTMTAGSVLFAGTSGLLSQDNANFGWDNTNKRLLIGDTTSQNSITVSLKGVVSSKPGIDFFSTISSSSSSLFNSGRIYTTFDAGNYAGARLTLCSPTNANTFTDVLSVKNGFVGVGITTPVVPLHIVATVSQMRIGYDTSNYLNTTVSSAGGVTFTGVGSSPAFAFAQSVGITGALTTSTSATIGTSLTVNGSSNLLGGLNIVGAATNGDFTLKSNNSNAFWDIVGIQANGNFSIADGNNAFAVSFLIEKGTPSNTLYLQATTGNVGIGTASPSAKIHAIKTTEQLRLGYDVSNYLSATVASTGSTTFALTGTSPLFAFSQGVGVTGNLKLTTAGNGLYIKEGSNATMGQATLSSGTVTVNTTKVTASSRIFLTPDGGTLTNVGFVWVSARSAGTSFTITSSNILDASNIDWMIVEPA